MLGMKERLELERGKHKPSEVRELILDNSKATQIEGLTDEYENLESLSIIAVGLTSLKGLPKLNKLRKLELSDNRLSNGLQTLVDQCPALVKLNLSGNKIRDIDTLKPLAGLKHLTYLDLYNCEVQDIDEYREQTFKVISQLKYLDGIDAEGHDAPDSDIEDADNLSDEDEDDDYDGESEDGEGDGEDRDDDGDDDAEEVVGEDDDVEGEGDLGDEEAEGEFGEEEGEEEDEEEEAPPKQGTKRPFEEEDDEEEDDE